MDANLTFMTLGFTLVVITLANYRGATGVPTANCKAKVLVLGAGIAGVSFAKTLQDHDETDFIILEGRDYIGGRIQESKLNGTTIELGASWVHLIGDDNPGWKLSQKYGLKSREDNYTNFVIR